MAKKEESPGSALARKRWEKTTPEERSAAAKKAAEARWGKKAGKGKGNS
jgi:hypothetical protein